MELWHYLRKMKMSQLEFSKLTGISPPRVSSFVRRLSTPGLKMALKIFEATHGQVTFREMLKIDNKDSFDPVYRQMKFREIIRNNQEDNEE